MSKASTVLTETADVFAHSWRPGSLDRRGLSPEALAKLRPGIIYVSVSCYGYDGPWASRAGYDPLGQVASGHAAGEGSTEAPIMASTFTLNDYLAAYAAAAGVDAALLQRARFGGSYHVKASLTGRVDVGAGVRRDAEEQFWSDGAKGVPALPAPTSRTSDDVAARRSAISSIRCPSSTIRTPRAVGTFRRSRRRLGCSWDF